MQAKQALDNAQAVHQRAATDYVAWNNALLAEQRNQQAALSEIAPTPAPENQIPIAESLDSKSGASPEVNKTDLIRDALRRRPTGLTPGDLWHVVKDQIPNRSYVYAVLGRLKERDQVTVRRGKYYIRAVAEKPDTQEMQETVVQ